MKYTLKIQLSDTRITYLSKTTRDTAYDKVLTELKKLGIPEENIHLFQVDAQMSAFSGNTEEKIVKRSDDQ